MPSIEINQWLQEYFLKVAQEIAIEELNNDETFIVSADWEQYTGDIEIKFRRRNSYETEAIYVSVQQILLRILSPKKDFQL